MPWYSISWSRRTKFIILIGVNIKFKITTTSRHLISCNLIRKIFMTSRLLLLFTLTISCFRLNVGQSLHQRNLSQKSLQI